MSRLIQVWIRCDHSGCDRMQDLLAEIGGVLANYATELPPGWAHSRSVIAKDSNGVPKCFGACYLHSALCPEHRGLPCEHSGIVASASPEQIPG